VSAVTLTVHRGARQIGGNCIEVKAPGGERLILDVGRPLDAPADAIALLPTTLDRASPADVLISHPHQDHWGLLDEVPSHWPIWCGAATERLVRLTAGLTGKAVARRFVPWVSGIPTSMGPFTVTALLTDHSAFDAHMILVEVAGKRILYSGDFRRHGRKFKLVTRLMASPPTGLDVLLMEGTNIGSRKPTISEDQLEAEFMRLFRATPGRVFVSWSAQNVDRTVTLYRACLQSQRVLVVDLYTAEVLTLLADYARLPQPGWDSLKVVITSAFGRLYRMKGRGDFVDRMARHGIAARKLTERARRWVIMVRPSLIRDYARNGVEPTPDDAWSWSMWRGYLDDDGGQRIQAWFAAGGARPCHIHTSGHAATEDLRAFAAAMNPAVLVPIHGVAWNDGALTGFPGLRQMADGETMVI
jgi:ribonuclease J